MKKAKPIAYNPLGYISIEIPFCIALYTLYCYGLCEGVRFTKPASQFIVPVRRQGLLRHKRAGTAPAHLFHVPLTPLMAYRSYLYKASGAASISHEKEMYVSFTNLKNCLL